MGKLILPVGVRLPRRYEILGTEEEKDATLKRTKDGDLSPGYIVRPTENELFKYYAVLNVDAPKVWRVFAGLSECLLKCSATLYANEDDEELEPIGSGPVKTILRILEPHKYQLANDGFLHFALVSESETSFSQVYVAGTKHFEVWFDDIDGFRERMNEFDVPECEELQLLSEIPHVTKQLKPGNGPFNNAWELIEALSESLLEAE